MRIGLKVGVGEEALVAAARRLWAERRFDFLELFVPRDASVSAAGLWSWYDGPRVLHAPHAAAGFNFASPEMATANAGALERFEALRVALDPGMTVFHPGLDGDPAEAIRQILRARTRYPALAETMLLENKPTWGLRGERCLGDSPAAMRTLLAATGCGFCLDVRHAAAYAAAAGREPLEVIGELAALPPRLWHAADGPRAATVDSHDAIGSGDMPWRAISAFWRADTPVTIECAKDPAKDLTDFLADADRLRRAIPSGGMTLRPAGPGDVELIWRLANDPATRANAYNSEPIPYASHVGWYAQRLEDSLCVMLIGETLDGIPVGYIRFTGMDDGVWEIDISIEGSFRGRGWGTELTGLGAEFMFEHRRAVRLHAWVKAENAASLGMFARAGFSPEGDAAMRCGILSRLLVLTERRRDTGR